MPCEHCPANGDESQCISCHRDRLDHEENQDAAFHARNREYSRAVLRWCAVGLLVLVAVSVVCGIVNRMTH